MLMVLQGRQHLGYMLQGINEIHHPLNEPPLGDIYHLMAVIAVFLQNTGYDKLLLHEALEHGKGLAPLGCSLACK
jgi:hypothetical protein